MVAGDVNTSFARDIVLMKLVGINPIVVHGVALRSQSF